VNHGINSETVLRSNDVKEMTSEGRVGGEGALVKEGLEVLGGDPLAGRKLHINFKGFWIARV
jgi:hypothetical protein